MSQIEKDLIQISYAIGVLTGHLTCKVFKERGFYGVYSKNERIFCKKCLDNTYREFNWSIIKIEIWRHSSDSCFKWDKSAKLDGNSTFDCKKWY